MRKNPAAIYAAILAVLLLSLLVAFNHQKPRIMVLHGFAEDGSWEQQFNQGFKHGLEPDLRPKTVRWRYMMYSNAMSARQWDAASLRSREIIADWQPDVLVAVGEEAQEYVAKHFSGDPNIRLVYAMAETPEQFGYPGAPNVTGVTETLPLAEIKNLLQYKSQTPLRISAIGVNDATGSAEAQQLNAFDWGAQRFSTTTLVDDYPAWQKQVLAANDHSDILLVLSAGGLPIAPGADKDVDNASLAAWTVANYHGLAIGVRESFVIDGGALAIVPSPVGLGQSAAKLALAAIPSKKRPKELPKATLNRDYFVAINPQKLQEYGLDLPEIYQQAARYSNSLY